MQTSIRSEIAIQASTSIVREIATEVSIASEIETSMKIESKSVMQTLIASKIVIFASKLFEQHIYHANK